MEAEYEILAIKMDGFFKEQFKKLAESKHLSMSAYARILLQESIDNADKT